MMSLFASDPHSTAPTARRLGWYGLFLVGMMIALWMGAQAVAMPSVESEPAPETADSTAVASPTVAEGTAGIEVFTWGNVAAFLLLAGGGGAALYLRRQQGGGKAPTRFRRLGKLGLGASKHVQLVACGGEVLLLSVTEDEVALLKTYPQAAFADETESEVDAPDALAGQRPPETAPGQWTEGFEKVLNRFADRPPRS